MLSMAQEDRSLNAAAGHGSQIGEGHAQRSLTCILTVSDDNTVGELTNGLIYVLVLTDSLIDGTLFCDYLAGAGGLQLVGCLCI